MDELKSIQTFIFSYNFGKKYEHMDLSFVLEINIEEATKDLLSNEINLKK